MGWGNTGAPERKKATFFHNDREGDPRQYQKKETKGTGGEV